MSHPDWLEWNSDAYGHGSFTVDSAAINCERLKSMPNDILGVYFRMLVLTAAAGGLDWMDRFGLAAKGLSKRRREEALALIDDMFGEPDETDGGEA